MNIGLAAVDAKIPNVALMKLGAWHRQRGDQVRVYDGPLFAGDLDRLYCSKQFNFTHDLESLPDCEIVRGGTGYDLNARLTEEQDTTYPAYDLYNCDYAIGRMTRGCIRNCPWCVVPKMDGHTVRQTANLDDFLRGQSKLRLLDDNLLAMPELFVETCEELKRRRTQVSFEAMDIRLIDRKTAQALTGVRRWGNIHFSYDRPEYEKAVKHGLDTLREAGYAMSKITFYVLIGFDTTHEEDMKRINDLDRWGVHSFVMPYNKEDRRQKHLARWCNAKPLFRSVSFEQYYRERTEADRKRGLDL